jgi:enterobactin synthetase component D / holo-[acyl-carrier protein] synthase
MTAHVAIATETESAEAKALRGLFPTDCAVAILHDAGHWPDLADCEAVHVSKANVGRRLEFAAGRACARDALRVLGLPPYAISVDDRRAPVWPHGLVGSISHCPGLCAAALARRPLRLAIGLDIETNDPLAEELRNVVATPRERGGLKRLGNASACDPFMLLFVLKEALFKLYFPATRHFLGFQDADAWIDPEAGTFKAAIVSSAPALGRTRSFAGRFAVTDGFVLAGLVA